MTEQICSSYERPSILTVGELYIANFLRRFDSSTNVPLSYFDICLRAIHYITKASTLTAIIQVSRKNHLFSKTQTLYVLRNPNNSVALYGWKIFKMETGHERQVGYYQLPKHKEKVLFQIWVDDFPFILECGRENY